MKLFAVWGASLLILSGCATVSDLPPGYRLDAQGNEGLAVISLTLSGKDLGRVESFDYRVRAVPSGERYAEVQRRPYFSSSRQHSQWIQDKNMQRPSGFQSRLLVKDQVLGEPLDVVEAGKPVGRLAALRLPAGEYELYDWRLVESNQYGGNEFSPRQDFVYRFKVEGGRTTYLGNLDLRVTDQDTFKIVVENKAKRDLALLARKAPAVSIEEVIYRPGGGVRRDRRCRLGGKRGESLAAGSNAAG